MINKKILFFFSILFLLSFVSASSLISELPDLCLPKNLTYYDIWLEDYYNIDVNETVRIRFTDPINGNTVLLGSGYATLNLECWEMAYYFIAREDGGLTTDLLRIETLDDDCDFDLTIRFYDTNGIDQTFNVNVSDNCGGSTPVDPNPVYINYSSNVSDDQISWFPFDDVLDDFSSGFNIRTSSGTPVFTSSNPVLSSSLHLVNSFNDVITYNSTGKLGENASLSFWFMGDNALGSAIFGCTNVLLSVYSNFSYYVDYGSAHYDGDSSSGEWNHVVFTKSGSNGSLYVNNVLVNNTIDLSAINLSDCRFYDSDASPQVDEFLVFNASINASVIDDLYNLNYNASVSSPAPSSSTIPDVYMNGSSYYYYNLSAYFGVWEDMFVKAKDPINNYTYQIYTGYSTLNADYYDLLLFANGTLQITSYERPYNFSVDTYACNYTPYEECSNETFQVYISANLSDVVELTTLQAYYNLINTNEQLFYGNVYYQYYDRMFFVFPDSNSTGALNSSFPFNYTRIDNPVGTPSDAEYMITMNCTIDQETYIYNFLGDLEVTMECGNQQVIYNLSNNNNYYQGVSLVAFNENSSLYQNTTIIGGSEDFLSGFYPQQSNITSSTSTFDRYVNSFSGILPDDLDTTGKRRLVFLILFIYVAFIFVVLYKISLKLACWLSIVGLIILTFFFAIANFMSIVYSVLILLIVIVYLLIKYFKGGL